MKISRILVVFLLISHPSWAQENAPLLPTAPMMKLMSPKHNDLISELIQKHAFDVNFLIPLFQNAVILPEILEKFNKAPEKRLEYHEYRELFFKSKGDLIAKGRSYMMENQSALAKAEALYGVPKEVVAAILGIETRFGQPGIEKYRAWDILNTAYILHPTRTDFYKAELIAFLKLCQQEGLDPLVLKGSYAGAMGVPQFIPTSILKYAVDADGDKKRDLWSSKEDIYASVANYLKENGWKQGGLIRVPLEGLENRINLQEWIQAGINKMLPGARATEMGIVLPKSVSPSDLISLVLHKPQADKEQLLVVFDNFRAIMRYNISVNYALVVTDLSEALALPNESPAPSEAPSMTDQTSTSPLSPVAPSPASEAPPPTTPP